MTRRLLVTGGNGVVGGYVDLAFPYDEILSTDVDTMDVRDPTLVRKVMGEFRPDVVLHLAAITDVDWCEQRPDEAFRTNALGTQNVALACEAIGALPVYISTAGVFSGDKASPYTEFDDPGPANVYGTSKLAGERLLMSFVPKCYIVRAGWMIGGGNKDRKFVGKMLSQIQEGARTLKAVNDKLGSPTYARDLVAGIRELIDTGYFGTHHMVNTGCCSRYDVAVAVVQILHVDVQVESVSSAYFPLPAPRARSEAMRNFKAELLARQWMRPWQDALREYLQDELGLGRESY